MSDLDDENCFTNCDELAKILKSYDAESESISALIGSSLRNNNKEIFIKVCEIDRFPKSILKDIKKCMI